MNENDGRSPASQGRAGGLRPEPATQSQPEALVPNATCHGKRSFSSHHWAMRGLRAVEREHSHDARRGHLHVYKCDECLGWHIGRGFATRRAKHRQRQDETPPESGRSARVFADADRIAKCRFPNGANAEQLGQIVREVLASGIEARSDATGTGAAVGESAARSEAKGDAQ